MNQLNVPHHLLISDHVDQAFRALDTVRLEGSKGEPLDFAYRAPATGEARR